jgi:hypothetical protein
MARLGIVTRKEDESRAQKSGEDDLFQAENERATISNQPLAQRYTCFGDRHHD